MSDLPNYDELVAVRLELARIRDHRDALQAGLTKEIRELIRSELSAQLDAVSCQLVERDDLKAENARLKADFSQMTAWGRGLESDLSRARVELMLVKAEVERLRAGSFVTAVPAEEYEKLRAELDLIYSLDPMIREAVASAKLAREGGRP